VARYLDVLDSYANDSAVLTEVRSALSGLSRFRKPRDWDTRPDLPATHTAPTIADLGDRSAVLRERVTELLAAGADLGAARDLADDLGRDTAALVASARALQRKEAELLTLLGTALLPENGGLPR
jgi:hypothetical protein